MRKLLLAIGAMALLAGTGAEAQVRVKGYVKKDGTYVAPHVRSNPNSSTLDNYDTKGNFNPNSGREGTRNPEPSWPTLNTRPVPSYPRATSPYSPRYTPPCYYNCGTDGD